MVRNGDREERRDEEESKNGQLGSRFQVVKALIGCLDSVQDGWRVEKLEMRPTKLVKSTKTPVSNGDMLGVARQAGANNGATVALLVPLSGPVVHPLSAICESVGCSCGCSSKHGHPWMHVGGH